MSGVLLISQRVKDQNILSFLHEFKVKKFSAELPADLIIPECQPSLAVISLDFGTEQRPMSTIIERKYSTTSLILFVFASFRYAPAHLIANSVLFFLSFLLLFFPEIDIVQSKFKNAYVICIDCDADRWLQLQLSTTSGSLRMLRVTSAAEGGRHLLEIYKALKDTEKLKLQRSFFENEEKNLVSQKTAIGIASSTFRNLGIPEQDGSLIMDAFTSLKTIITASREDLSFNSPADQQSIDKLVNFFSASHC